MTKPAAKLRPTITLLTDFGTRDVFVGVMKGVIASIAPQATVVDLCHEVEPFQVAQARFLLKQSWPFFSKGTIHVCVVDPGVGSARRALCVEAAGHRFIGPDNGLFTDVLSLPGAKAREITSARYMLKSISQTFHGRDVFAPAAAHLAAGAAPAGLGRIVKDAARAEAGGVVRIGRRFFLGQVAHIDRFGNVITNLESAEFLPLAVKGIQAKVGFEAVRLRADSYAAAPEGELFLIAGSAGTLEISLREASAAKRLGVGIGAPVELEVW
ncbi:MAG: SAM-dependent chlorinase/fluorinase [Acidobacteria bacterium]|nr:SAM-dependent chlorinase/fluorinase [Acidobacteriota bacterium]